MENICSYEYLKLSRIQPSAEDLKFVITLMSFVRKCSLTTCQVEVRQVAQYDLILLEKFVNNSYRKKQPKKSNLNLQ